MVQLGTQTVNQYQHLTIGSNTQIQQGIFGLILGKISGLSCEVPRESFDAPVMINEKSQPEATSTYSLLALSIDQVFS